MIIGRKAEIQLLNQAYKSPKAEFIAIFGRRRIGKTFLVKETFQNSFSFYHTGISNEKQTKQLAAFDSSLQVFGDKTSKPSKNWLEAFMRLRYLLEEKDSPKKIIFLDELSWMATNKSEFLSALEFFWNSYASSKKNILLIVSASATSWLLENVIHSKGGLYNRLTHTIQLDPFCLEECDEFVKYNQLSMSRPQVLEAYMVFGGIPYYWSLFSKGLSVAQNIDHLLFSRNAELKMEFEYLYSSLFRKPEVYIKIITVLGKRKKGLTRQEICEMTNIANTGFLTKKLSELFSCGFIREYLPFGKEKKGSLFQLIDVFSLFYFQFLDHRSTDEHFFENSLQSNALNAWRGLAFEKVCLMHVPQMKKALGISGVSTNVCEWHCKANDETGINGHQIDLLIVRKDQIINMCEMKYSLYPYTVTSENEFDWQKRISDFLKITKTPYSIHFTLVTPYGIKDNCHSSCVVKTIGIDDLFQLD